MIYYDVGPIVYDCICFHNIIRVYVPKLIHAYNVLFTKSVLL